MDKYISEVYTLLFVVYHKGSEFIIKSINQEVKTRPIYDCRCDERLEPKNDEFTCVVYTGLLEELDLEKRRDLQGRRSAL